SLSLFGKPKAVDSRSMSVEEYNMNPVSKEGHINNGYVKISISSVPEEKKKRDRGKCTVAESGVARTRAKQSQPKALSP
ncbi:hypothetical protein RUM43_002626, partial [Polyplax serrata]